MDLSAYRDVQQIARDAVAHLETVLEPGMHLAEVRGVCEDFMLAHGADSFWYYGIGAFVFSGDETAVSLSGRDYRTPDRTVQRDDIVTVDLSPQRAGIWGDFARTLILEDGKVRKDPAEIRNPEWRRGLLTEQALHRELREFARSGQTFSELCAHMNAAIQAAGFVNLDFRGNLGHSIEREISRRIYMEPCNEQPLSAAGLFTFEPHIGLPGSAFGFKHENICYFADGTLQEL